MDRSGPTPRQLDILAYIKRYIETHGYGPSIREIGAGNDISSPNGVKCHLRALEKKGLIVVPRMGGRGIGRAIQIVEAEEKERPAKRRK